MIRTIKTEDIIRFEEHLVLEEKSGATISKYLRDIKAFIRFADGREITKELAIAYKKSLLDNGYKSRSINSMLASLSSFLDFMGWQDAKVRNLKIQHEVFCQEEKELTRDEYIRLLEAARRKPKTALVIETIAGTGIRVSELQFFTVEAVRNGEVNVYCKRKNRKVFVPSKLRKKLLKYAKEQRIASGIIFRTKAGNPMDRSNIWSEMKKLCKVANVSESKVFPHNLRKLFARVFYGIEKDIAKLADILGHSSIDTTRIYIMSTGVEHRRRIEQMHLIM